MLESAVDRYKQVRIQTTSPGELLVALYDGLFRFLNGAKLCIEKGETARGRELIGKSHAIISELYIALDHEKAPELCIQLENVYEFSMHQLTQANLKTDPALIAEVIQVLTPLRDAWNEAVPQAAREALGDRRTG